MKGKQFHFSQELTAAEIQLFVKVVKSMMSDQYATNYTDLVHFELPTEAKTIDELHAICKDDSCIFLNVTTPKFKNLEYINERSTQISNLNTSLSLSSLQRQYSDFKNNTPILSFVETVDKLLGAFVCINTDLTIFFVNKADNDGSFSWKEKYGPCFFDRERFVTIRGDICQLTMEDIKGKIDHHQVEVVAKCLLMNLLYQCGFLAFWCCLVDVATFPGNTPQENEVLGRLIDYLLRNYHNLYLYNLTVESNPIEGGCFVNRRGASENTTRIKLYFTRDDDSPVLMRLDLPHEGHPFVHLNIEEGENNDHIQISKEVEGDEYDHVFDSLSNALLWYDFNAADYYHTPVAKDKEIMRDMRFRTALFNYAPNVLYYLIMGEKADSENHPFIMRARNTLIDLLELGGAHRDELAEFSPFDLLELAYGELFA